MSAKPARLAALRIRVEPTTLDVPDALVVAQARATRAHLASFGGDVCRFARAAPREARPPADQPSGLDSAAT